MAVLRANQNRTFGVSGTDSLRAGWPSCLLTNIARLEALTQPQQWPNLILFSSTTGLLTEEASFPLNRLCNASIHYPICYKWIRGAKCVNDFPTVITWSGIPGVEQGTIWLQCALCHKWTVVVQGFTAHRTNVLPPCLPTVATITLIIHLWILFAITWR